jgi:hypothetical protein
MVSSSDLHYRCTLLPLLDAKPPLLGRCLAIVPRVTSKNGYMDIEEDDFAAGSEVEKWQNVALEITRRSRVAPPKP